MGSGVSSLTVDQSNELNRLMKKEFYRNFSGKSEDEVRLYLSRKYEEYKQQVLANKAPARGSIYRPETQKLETKVTFSSTISTAASFLKLKTRTTRKSSGDLPTLGGCSNGFIGINYYYLMKHTDLLFIAEDCWDSVSQQPYCTYCRVAFRTVAAYDIHANTVMRCLIANLHRYLIPLIEFTCQNDATRKTKASERRGIAEKWVGETDCV